MTHTALSLFRHHLLTALVVLPVLVMSVFPQGTMAARGADGIEVVLCTGHGPLTVIVDENGAPLEEQPAEIDCGWWLLGQGLCLSASPDLPVPVAVAMRIADGTAAHLVPGTTAAAPYPARAPPRV